MEEVYRDNRTHFAIVISSMTNGKRIKIIELASDDLFVLLEK